jgi:hypothetical protein
LASATKGYLERSPEDQRKLVSPELETARPFIGRTFKGRVNPAKALKFTNATKEEVEFVPVIPKTG